MLKLYLSSGFPNRDNARTLAKYLLTDRTKYLCLTSTWFNTDPNSDPIFNSSITMNENIAMKECAILIVLLPGGYGTHREIGFANALGKEVYICHVESDQARPEELIVYQSTNTKFICGKDLVDIGCKLMKELIK